MNIFSRKRLMMWVVAVLVILNLLTLGTFWYRESTRLEPHSKSRYDRRFPQPDKHERRLQEELNLTEEQVSRLIEIRKRFFERLEPKKRNIHQLNTEIMTEAFSPAPDIQISREIARKVGAIESDIALDLFDHFQELKVIVRPDQQEQLHQLFIKTFRHRKPPGEGNQPVPPELKE